MVIGMEKEQSIKRIVNGIFYTGLVIETILVLLDKSNYIIQHETFWFRFTFILFGIKVCFTKYSRKEWLALIGFAMIGVLSWYFSDREEVIRIVMFCAACKGLEPKKVLKGVFYLTLAGCIIIMLLSVLGIYGDVTRTEMYRNDILETRYVFGMGHPNAFHCMLLMLMLLWIYIKFDKLKLYHLLIAMGINIIAYLFTTSRTGIMVTSLAIIAAAAMKYVPKLAEWKGLYVLGGIALALTVVLAIGVAWYGVGFNYKGWSSLLLDKIDFTIFSARLRYAYFRADLTRWSLFSCPENTRYFDMGIVRLFYWYGYIPGFLYMIMNGLLVRHSYKTKDYGIFIMVMLCALYQLFEAHTISVFIGRNYLLLLMGVYAGTMLGLLGSEEVHWWQFFRKKVKYE